MKVKVKVHKHQLSTEETVLKKDLKFAIIGKQILYLDVIAPSEKVSLIFKAQVELRWKVRCTGESQVSQIEHHKREEQKTLQINKVIILPDDKGNAIMNKLEYTEKVGRVVGV